AAHPGREGETAKGRGCAGENRALQSSLVEEAVQRKTGRQQVTIGTRGRAVARAARPAAATSPPTPVRRGRARSPRCPRADGASTGMESRGCGTRGTAIG